MTTQKEFIQRRQQEALLERLERRIGAGRAVAGAHALLCRGHMASFSTSSILSVPRGQRSK